MKKWDKFNTYPFNKYGNAVVLSDLPDYKWMEENLTHTQPKWNEDCNGQSYFVGHFVGHQTWSDEEGNRMFSFYDPENRRRILELLPHLVVEADPFGPDLCRKCGGPA